MSNLVPQQPGSLATRRFVPMTELAQLVAVEVSKLLAAGQRFSAYSVTLELRRANPTLEIVHEPSNAGDQRPTVREAVHTAMVAAMQQGRAGEGWKMEWVTVAGRQARWYFPPAQPVLSGSQAAQAVLPGDSTAGQIEVIDGEGYSN